MSLRQKTCPDCKCHHFSSDSYPRGGRHCGGDFCVDRVARLESWVIRAESALEFMRDCGDRPGMYEEASELLADFPIGEWRS